MKKAIYDTWTGIKILMPVLAVILAIVFATVFICDYFYTHFGDKGIGGCIVVILLLFLSWLWGNVINKPSG